LMFGNAQRGSNLLLVAGDPEYEIRPHSDAVCPSS
jgi:hypothetical protein